MLRVSTFARGVTFAAILAFVAGCGGGGDDGGTVTPTPTIGVSTSTATLSVTGGATATSNITVTRGGGYAGSVDLTAEGLPTGVTAAFAPASVANGSTSSVLTLTAASTAAAGTANVTVRAKGTGTADATSTIALTVVAAPVQSFSQTLAPTAVTLAQGGTTTSTLNFTRNNGFTGAIGVATTGAPAGLTVTPASTSVTGNSVALNVAATNAVAAGTYNVTVTSTGTGVATQTSTLAVTVTATPAGSYTIALSPTTVTLPATGTAGTGTATLNLTRTNFTGDVAIAVTGAPTGLTVTPASNTTTGNSVVLNVASTAALAAGSYPVTITTSSAGTTNQTATLTVTVPAAPAAGVTIAVTPTTVALPAGGGTGTATVNLTRTNFTGAVNLAITGAPANLTAALASASTTGNSVGITLTSTAAVPAGTYPLTITASGTGITNSTATLTVTVPASVGGFSIAVTPTTINLARGSSTTVTVDITRTGGFTGAVDLDVPNLPQGVTATIAPVAGTVRFARAPLTPRGASHAATPITTGKATITLTASATANTGNFNLSVTAAAAGYPTQTSTSSTVTVSNPSTGSISAAFCGSNATPIWLAVQDGTGAWTQITPSAGTFSFNINSAKGGIAFVQPSGTGFQTTIYYGTKAELTSYAAGQCGSATPGTLKSLTGSVANLGTASGIGSSVYASIGTSGSSATVTSPATTFTLNNVPNGSLDYLAGKVTQSFDLTAGTFSTTLNKLIIRRGQNYTGSIPVFDFNAAEAFDPVQRTVTLTGANAGEISTMSVAYLTNATTGQGASVPLYSSSDISGGTTRTIYTVPTAQQQANDLHIITAITTPTTTSGTIASRGVIKFQKASANATLAYGPALNTPTVTTLSATSPLRYQVQMAVQTQYNQIFTANWFQTGSTSRTVSVLQTTGYTGGAAWDASIPDLSGAGYNATWGLQAGTTVASTYTAAGYDFNIANGLLDNGTEYFATRTNTSGLSVQTYRESVIPAILRRVRSLPTNR